MTKDLYTTALEKPEQERIYGCIFSSTYRKKELQMSLDTWMQILMDVLQDRVADVLPTVHNAPCIFDAAPTRNIGSCMLRRVARELGKQVDTFESAHEFQLLQE